MEVSCTQELSLVQQKQLLLLWNREYPVNLAHTDIQSLSAYLASLKKPRHRLLWERDELKGWYCDFHRDGGRWFAMILDSDTQGKGIGSQLLNMAKQENEELNGWVIDHLDDKKADGSSYSSPLEFYVKNGFSVQPKARLELDNISAVKVYWSKINE